MVRWLRFSVALLAALAVVGTVAPTAGAARVPRLKHVWVFVLENHSYNEIIGSADAPSWGSYDVLGAFIGQQAASGDPWDFEPGTAVPLT